MIPSLYRTTLTGAPHENCSFIQRQKTAASNKDAVFLSVQVNVTGQGFGVVLEQWQTHCSPKYTQALKPAFEEARRAES